MLFKKVVEEVHILLQEVWDHLVPIILIQARKAMEAIQTPFLVKPSQTTLIILINLDD